MGNTIEKKVVELFWTGGFDSTFRVVELSRCDIRIRPYYALEHRECEQIELEAISKISKALREHPSTKAILEDVVLLDESDIKIPEQVGKAYLVLKERYKLGSQYDKLAVFAASHPGVELGAVKGGKLRSIVEENGELEKVHDENIGDYYQVNTSVTCDDVNQILGNYHFGLLEKSKSDMLLLYKNMGYTEIMEMTWFCHHPVNGKPCGVCNPCSIAIEEGLSERMTKQALFRNKHRFLFTYLLGIRRRALRVFGGGRK